MRLALVYDRVNKIGGAERVLEALHEIWPEAPLYTAVYNPQTAPWAKKFKVIPSFLNKFPLAKKHHQLYPWLTPLAFEIFDFSGFDVVISVTSEAAKGIITKPGTLHLCYCLTPTRYLWSGYKDYFKDGIFKSLTKPMVNYLRHWDKVAAQRPDKYIAISKNIQRRIKKYYGWDSVVIYPPVTIQDGSCRSSAQLPFHRLTRRGPFNWAPDSRHPSGFFLVVSRLVPYKRVDIAVEAFNQLGLPLKIVGVGSQMGKLRAMAKSNIEFLGQLTDEELLNYYQGCEAVIFPQAEDFGLVPLEAQACGKPVIAFKGGGALETVAEGKTGEFFYPQTVEALKNRMAHFDASRYNSQDCRQNAQRFNKERFKKEWKNLLKTISMF